MSEDTKLTIVGAVEKKERPLSYDEHRVRAYLHGRFIDPGVDPIGVLINAHKRLAEEHNVLRERVYNAVESLKDLTNDFVPF